MPRAGAVGVLVVALLVWSGLAAGGAAAAPSRVAWSKCHAELGPFQCGTVQVPLDYDQPNGATISIALIRLPATDPQHRIGSLLLNPGGPGGSGVELHARLRPAAVTDEVRARFDMVGFDPRGIARSSRSTASARATAGPVLPPFAFPSTPEEKQTGARPTAIWTTPASARRRIAEHMSTANVARDLDLLRQAVGDRQLTYVGFSYGSYSARPTPTCSPTRCGRSSSTACSTRSRGRPEAGTSGPSRSRRGSAATPALRRRSTSSSGSATPPARHAQSRAPRRTATRRSPPG